MRHRVCAHVSEASVHTTFFDPDRFGARLSPERVRTWPLQRVPRARSHFRALFPLYATYFSAISVDADLVLSSSIAFSKAARTRKDAVHLSYVYTPMRYAWDLDTYLSQSSYSVPARAAARLLRPTMQRWDRWTARRPDGVVAISRTVAERIERTWKRDVDAVIYPPVRVDEIPFDRGRRRILLVAARLRNRRIDVAVRACTALGRELSWWARVRSDAASRRWPVRRSGSLVMSTVRPCSTSSRGVMPT